MLALARDVNELPLLMSSSWPRVAFKKWGANPRPGLFYAPLHSDDWLALAHGEQSWLPDETAGWAYAALSEHDG